MVDPPLRVSGSGGAIYVEKQDESGAGQAPEWIDVRSNDAYIEPPPRLSDLPFSAWESMNVPLGISMFEDLLCIDHGHPFQEPSSAAYGSRRLILARTANTFQAAFSAVYDLALASTAGIKVSEEMSSLDFANLEKRAWRSEWEGRRFTQLWEQRENLELLRYRLRQNIQAIEKLTPDANYLKMVRESLQSQINYKKPSLWVQRHILAFYKQQQNDLLEWQSLDKTADYINEVVVRTTESYLQTVAARESQASNFQATRCVSPSSIALKSTS